MLLAEKDKKVSDITVGELTELIKTIIFEVIKPETLSQKEISTEEKLKALAFMDRLSNGLGRAKTPNDGADNHDKYIYEE